MFMIPANQLIAVARILEDTLHRVEKLHAHGAWENARTQPIDQEDREFLVNASDSVVELLQSYGCPLTALAYRRLKENVAASSQICVEEYCNRMSAIFDRFTDEMETNHIFIGTRERDLLWGKNDHVSQLVKDRFPGIAQELRASGSACCTTLFTASVFHSMRAAETGLRAVAAELEIDLTGDESMKNLVDAIRSSANAFADGPKSPNKRSRSQRYCELAIEAGLFKDAWRNHVTHGRVTYDEMQAREVLKATCRLFEKLVAPLADV